MLGINFITGQNPEERMRSCLQKGKLNTKVYNAVMLYISHGQSAAFFPQRPCGQYFAALLWP